jgi:hypothetical protein
VVVVNVKIVTGTTTVREALRTNTLAVLTGFSIAAQVSTGSTMDVVALCIYTGVGTFGE